MPLSSKPARRAFWASLVPVQLGIVLTPCALARQDHAFPASQERWRLAARLALLEGVRRALGKPYVWGASGPDAFDCSGLVLWLYGRIGVRLPRVAVEQGSVGIAVPDRLRFGDVLLFKRKGPGWHIGLYLARGRFVHAEGRGRGVTISLLRASGYAQRLCRARRYLR